MTQPTVQLPALTLRFRNEETLLSLRRAADALGISISELAEAAIAHELALIRTDLDHQLTHAVDLLRSYRGQGIHRDIDAFAEAEVHVDDPLQTRASEDEDVFGIGDLFAHPMEQR